jgi:excisionase family DNA binding protein
MFDQATVEQLADALARRLKAEKPKQPERWPELMSIKTAAQYLDRSEASIRHLLDAKMLPICKIDGRVQIRRVDLDRLIERKTA